TPCAAPVSRIATRASGGSRRDSSSGAAGSSAAFSTVDMLFLPPAFCSGMVSGAGFALTQITVGFACGGISILQRTGEAGSIEGVAAERVGQVNEHREAA